MPSGFLASRYNKLLAETSGDSTVKYIAINKATRDALTGDIDETSAYSSTSISLPARIDFSPTKSIRELAGIDIKFDAVVRLSTLDLNEASILSISIGDVFILPDMPNIKRYVIKVVKRKQSGEEFLEQLVFVTRNVKGRG